MRDRPPFNLRQPWGDCALIFNALSSILYRNMLFLLIIALNTESGDCMQTRLSGRNLLFIGTMLFGLFFGAGNLIFPIYLGQQAGGHVGAAIIGLLITGIGLPLLGVIGMGLTRSDGVFDLAQRVNRPYAYCFTILLYFTLGPLFAMPRLATTAFQIGLVPFVSRSLQPGVLLGFSVGFLV